MEEGIQVRKLLFLREKDFKLLEILKEKFLRRTRSFWKGEKEALKTRARKAVERRTVNEARLDREGFEYESSEYWKGRETEYWRWMRVYEYHRGRTEQERLEWQEEVAIKVQERSRINAKLIKYIW